MVEHIQREIAALRRVLEGNLPVKGAAQAGSNNEFAGLNAGGGGAQLHGGAQPLAGGEGAIGGRHAAAAPEIVIDAPQLAAFHLRAAAVAVQVIGQGVQLACAGAGRNQGGVSAVAADVIEAQQYVAAVGCNRDGIGAVDQIIRFNGHVGGAVDRNQVAAGGCAGAVVEVQAAQGCPGGDAQHGLVAHLPGIGQAGIA